MLATGEDAKVIEQFGKTELKDPAATADLLAAQTTALSRRVVLPWHARAAGIHITKNGL